MKPALKLDLLIIVVLLIAINIPMLTGGTPIAYDTFASYEEFAVTYNAVYFHGQLPLWLPYASYGMPDILWLGYLSIVNFLFIGLGRLFQIQNALLLFKASLFGEQLISVFGMYLLANRIFRKKTTVLLTCLAFMTTFVVYIQVALNFRMVYLLPLVLFWIVLFFQGKSAAHLWLAAITIVFSVPGSAFYPLIIEFYSIALFSAVLFIYDLKAASAIFRPSRASLAGLTGLVLILLVFLYYFGTFRSGVDVMRAGRSADFKVPIAEYLTEGKSWNPLDLAASFLYGVISPGITDLYEYSFYIGLLPLAGVVAAVLYQRKGLWYATLAAGVFLYAFSLRGYVAFATYFLPFADVTRYIAVLGMIPFRTFLILAAGIGLDMSLSSAQWKRVGIVLLGIALVAEIGGAISTSTGYGEILGHPSGYSTDVRMFLLRVGSIVFLALLAVAIHRLIFRGNRDRPIDFPAPLIVSIGLLLLTVTDLALYHYNYEKKVHGYLTALREQALSLPSLQPLVYQGQRLMDPPDKKTLQAMNSAFALQSGNPYSMESFVQFDRCIPAAVSMSGRFEFFSSSLMAFIKHRAVLVPIENAPMGLRQIYGCQFPKLRVISNVYVGPTNKLAWSAILKTDDFSNLLVLSKAYSDEKTALNNPPPKAEIQVVKFSPNQIQVDVDLQQDKGWLVYSDAYHPDWQATVNGKTRQIERAYLAFKAIPLARGINHVVMNYGSPFKHIAYSLLAILCGAAALVLFGGLVFILLFDHGHIGSNAGGAFWA